MSLHSIIEFDVRIFSFINSHHTPFFDAFFWVVTQLGNLWVVIPLTALSIAVATRRQYVWRAIVCAIIAGTFSGIVSVQVKRAVDRPRPLSYFETHPYPCPAKRGDSVTVRESGACAVHVVGDPWRRYSFPSGHAMTAFTAATIFAALFGGCYFLAFAPAFLVAYSRVYMGVHFPFDTFGGAVFGIVIAYLVVWACRRLGYVPSAREMRRQHAER